MKQVIINYVKRLLDDITKSKIYKDDESLYRIVVSFKNIKEPENLKDCKEILTGIKRRFISVINDKNRKTVIKLKNKIGFNLYTINGLMSRGE